MRSETKSDEHEVTAKRISGKNRAYIMLAVLFLVAFVTTFNYGGCGKSSSGSSAPTVPAAKSWGTAGLLETDNAGDAYSSQVAFDSGGNACAVWQQSDGITSSIWANRYVAGTGWAGAALIETDDTGPASSPQVAFDSGGNAIAVWHQSDGTRNNIYANRYVTGTGWAGAALIETDDTSAANSPQVAVDSQGNAFAVWYQNDGTTWNIWANRYISGTGWAGAGLIETDAGDAYDPQIDLDSGGNAIAVWYNWDGANYSIWANRFGSSAPAAPAAPAAPNGVSATVGNTKVIVNWNTSAGATSYNLYWSTTSGVTTVTGTQISNVTRPYTHTGRTNGVPYYYVVTAVNSLGQGSASSEVSATPLLTLTRVGSYGTSSYAQGLYVAGSYAYVAETVAGLQIIYISDPAAPVLAGSYDTTGAAFGVSVAGTYAYVADGFSGLQIIDISDPANPTISGTYNTPGYASAVYLAGSYAYVADGSSGLQIINISNPAAPTFVGSYDTLGDVWGKAYDVYVTGSYAYVADGNSGLQIIDISNPAAPTLVGLYNTENDARGIYVVGSYAYVGDGTSGLQIIRVE